jgi:hypothetical protein
LQPKQQSLRAIVDLLSESTAVKLLALVAGFLALISFNLETAPLAVRIATASVIPLLIIQVLAYSLRRYSLKPFPSRESTFDPFGVSASWAPWQREEFLNQFCPRLETQSHKHMLLIGSTGVGKSVLIASLLPKRFPNHLVVGPITEFERAPQTILVAIANAFPNSPLNSRIFDITSRIALGASEPVEPIAEELPKLLQDTIGITKSLFLFDQVERYLVMSQNMSKRDTTEFERITTLVRVILKTLREIPSVHTVFAIRSEFFFGSIGNLFHTRSDGKGLEDVVEFHLMWGINKSDDGGIFSKLSEQLDKSLGSGGRIPARVANLASFHNKLNADSFALRLGAFLYRELYSRPKYKRALDNSGSIDDLVDILLDAAFEGASKEINELEFDRALYDSILFSIAAENQSTGRGCSLTRVAGLSHFPAQNVQDLVEYLTGIGILREEPDDGDASYRIVHDRISDRILKSERLELHSRSLNAIRSLTENEAPTSSLTIPDRYPAIVEVNTGGLLNLSYISFLIFLAFGFTRMLFSAEMKPYFDHLYSFFGSSIYFRSPDYYTDPLFYLPHFLTHAVWLSYIDRMHRSFIVFTGDPLSQLIGRTLTTVGLVCGIFSAFLPQLFVMPLFFVGVLYGVALLRTSRGPRFVGEIRRVVQEWGRRTILNMAVMMLLGMASASWFVDVTSLLPSERNLFQSNAIVYFLMILIESLILLWFWQHIRADQNSRRIWSANLALFDKGRLRLEVGKEPRT